MQLDVGYTIQTRPASIIADVELYQPKIVGRWIVWPKKCGWFTSSSFASRAQKKVNQGESNATNIHQWSWMGIAGGNHKTFPISQWNGYPNMPMVWAIHHRGE